MYAASCVLWRVQMTKFLHMPTPHSSTCFSLFDSRVSSHIGSRALLVVVTCSPLESGGREGGRRAGLLFFKNKREKRRTRSALFFQGDLLGPVGFDEHSYGYCSKSGDFVHNSRRQPMGSPYGEGDVVGVHLYMPPGGKPRLRTREAVYWGRKIFWQECSLTGEASQLQGSYVAFYLNGVKQGEVKNIAEGTYHPALSPFTLPSQQEPVVLRCSFASEPGPPTRFASQNLSNCH